MKGHWPVKVVKILVLVTVAVALFGAVVMGLWNLLLPPLFGLPAIGFWQALGLLVLCRILFGGFGPGHHARGRHGLRERWERMTPEEREELRASLQARMDKAPSGSEPAV